MEIEKYTDRAKGFLQSAQTMALRRGHQRLTPEHLLKVLLEDSEGLCANLIRAAGGDPKAALQAVDAELDRLPKVEGSGAGQVYMSPELARVFEQSLDRFAFCLALPADEARAVVGNRQLERSHTDRDPGFTAGVPAAQSGQLSG